MKRSLKGQMIMIFVGLVVSLLLIFYVVNNSFLEQFYVYNKTEEFKGIMTEMEDAVMDGSVEEKETLNELMRVAERGNISLLIVDEATSTVLFNNTHDNMLLLDKLMRYALNQQSDIPQEEMEKTEDYTLTKSIEPANKIEYLEMLGQFDDGSWFIMRSPIESIRESAKISNKFLLYVGMIITLLSVVLVWYFAKRFTQPILELTAVSKRMTELEFDVKYKSGGKNEIGVLGENFNKMSEKLETTISELKNANLELQRDIEKKEKTERIRSEFMGNVSHELKTPIALIQGYAEGLKEGINEDLESREFYCDVIIDEATKMNQLVKNLMSLNQVEAGGDETLLERFDIVQLISGVLQSSEILIQQKEVSIHFSKEHSVYVWGDQFKVEQVVRNYIQNALNHLDGDRVIDIKEVEVGEKVRISVFNTGHAIPEEDVERIWDKFYKVDKAHTREYGGNGIGLSIVKAIMESMKQEYGVKNYDNGVEFWFELDIK
ncbi:HAMP domain-containing histidine kinase [Lachnospiraceae bacterium OttesenSCG-928-E19]|nr:HAMP domain-containing histidine kinase [Lachnospiraceae bacterium OttesenSCG-928-E19]